MSFTLSVVRGCSRLFMRISSRPDPMIVSLLHLLHTLLGGARASVQSSDCLLVGGTASPGTTGSASGTYIGMEPDLDVMTDTGLEKVAAFHALTGALGLYSAYA